MVSPGNAIASSGHHTRIVPAFVSVAFANIFAIATVPLVGTGLSFTADDVVSLYLVFPATTALEPHLVEIRVRI